jgi:hypothetical protein
MNEQNDRTSAGTQTGVRVLAEVGNPYVEPGRTRVEVQSDGQVTVLNQLEDETQRAEGKVDPSRISRLVDESSPERFSRQMTERLGLPDEPRYHIEVERGGQQVLAIDVWRSDLESMPGVARLIRELDAVTKEASDGRFIL